MTCNYCDRPAIGYEKEYFGPGETWRIHVCADCAHVDATVHLVDGSTLRKKPITRERTA
tara:strand:+ start:62 stop:238 length:177 start_codon:yes stop_codon:yes gene_type:complete